MDFSTQRERLVERYVKQAGVSDGRVLDAVRRVPRHEFVPAEHRYRAYVDGPIPIGSGQVITQPSLVARMTEQLQLTGDEKVLEVGTGSGYQAAVLSLLVEQVHTIERVESLAREAERRLTRLGYDNVEVHVGDGTNGLPEEAPFDGIMVTAGGPEIPHPLIKQLRDGGRIVAPVGRTPTNQRIEVGVKQGNALNVEESWMVRFVPLIGEHGWDDRHGDYV